MEHHRPDQRFDIEFPSRGGHGALQDFIDSQVLPECMKRKDITEAEPELLDDF